MRLKSIRATPHPSGNRIDLTWVNPDPDQYPGVRIVRREGTHPTTPQDGFLVMEADDLPYTLNENGERLYHVKDENLKGETVYYYTLFPYQGTPPPYQTDGHNRTAAMATAPHDVAGRMYDLLPGVYHRYDTILPAPGKALPGDEQKGQLRRFLDLPGGQLDQLYSFARAMLDLYNPDEVDGRLLSLLAGWIGWGTDYRREIDTQRNEIRNAPYVYQTIGIIPSIEATVKRVLGWESRTKEFVHNVFVSNRPERLNLWTCHRFSSGEWSEPTDPLSLDFAYEGRPATILDADGTLWLFYHTLKNDRWDIWYKTLSTFNVALGFKSDLEAGTVSTDLKQAFADEGFSLSQNATIEEKNSEWLITDAENEERYIVREEDGQLNIYRWTPSQPLTHRKRFDRHPTAVVWDGTLRVYWDSYDETSDTWQINYRTQQTDGSWSSIATFAETDPTTAPERRRPWAVVDDTGGLWLFWLEKVVARWELKYNRHDGTDWQLEPAATFPLDGGEDPRVESDLFVLFHPTDPTQSLWVFWARQEPTGEPGQTRWGIVYRVKESIDPHNISDWSPVRTLPKPLPDDYHDREPAVLLDAAGNIELFWSSNQDRSWSIWHNTLNITTHDWGTAQKITDDPYSQRDPLPVSIAVGTLLIYHSNESLAYTSAVYGATETLDARYAGCTTVDTRNVTKIALRDEFEDFQTYIYDAGQDGEREEQNWYARDTVGIYLNPTTEDPELIIRNRNLVENVLRQFLPVQVRAVFIIEPTVHTELVYTYDFPTAEPQRLIAEQFFDSTLPEVYSGLGDDYQDTAPGWVWLRTWSMANPEHRTVDTTTTPIDTRFRTWHTGIVAGG